MQRRETDTVHETPETPSPNCFTLKSANKGLQAMTGLALEVKKVNKTRQDDIKKKILRAKLSVRLSEAYQTGKASDTCRTQSPPWPSQLKDDKADTFAMTYTRIKTTHPVKTFLTNRSLVPQVYKRNGLTVKRRRTRFAYFSHRHKSPALRLVTHES